MQSAGSAPFVHTIRQRHSMCRPSAEMCNRQKDMLWASRAIRGKGQKGAAELGKEVIDGPEAAATHAQVAVVHTNEGNGLRPCSPSAMRARLGGVRQPQECKV